MASLDKKNSFDSFRKTDSTGVPFQKHVRDLKSGYKKLYETLACVDVILSVGARKFRAHRVLLASRSKVFFDIFLKKGETQTVHLELTDITEDGCEVLLRFIYTDETGSLSDSQVLEAHEAAVRYEQTRLRKLCEELIKNWEITYENVCALLNRTAHIPAMKEKCMTFIKENVEAVLQSEAFLQMDIETLERMLNANLFKDVPPMLLLENVIRWASSKFARSDLLDEQGQKNYRIVRELLTSTRPTILGALGIQNLAAENLTKINVEYKGLLTKDEGFAFFMNLQKPGSETLPEWCNV